MPLRLWSICSLRLFYLLTVHLYQIHVQILLIFFFFVFRFSTSQFSSNPFLGPRCPEQIQQTQHRFLASFLRTEAQKERFQLLQTRVFHHHFLGEFEGRIPLLNHLMDPYGTISLPYLLPQKVYSFGLQGLVFSTKWDIAARAEKENNKAVISTVQFCLNFKTKLLYIMIW